MIMPNSNCKYDTFTMVNRGLENGLYFQKAFQRNCATSTKHSNERAYCRAGMSVCSVQCACRLSEKSAENCE